MNSRYETEVNASSPNNAHGIALQLVGTGKRVLELGAAAGHFTRALVDRGNSVFAIEVDDTLEAPLREITADVLIADLDQIDLIQRFPRESFDVVMAGDVLEHTLNGPLILEQIRHLLAPHGFLVVSVPNIAHGDVRLSLLIGNFEYRETGLLDRTHRVFYTRDSACQLLEASGFIDLEVFTSTTPVGSTELRPPLDNFPSSVLNLIEGDPDSHVYQFIIRAHPRKILSDETSRPPEITKTEKSGQDPEMHQIDVSRRHNESLRLLNATLVKENRQLTEKVGDLEGKVRDLEARLDKSMSDLRRTQQITQGEMDLQMRDEFLGLLAELGEARYRLNEIREQHPELTLKLAQEMTRAYEAERRVLDLERSLRKTSLVQTELESVYASKSWRVGRLITSPIRLFRRLFR